MVLLSIFLVDEFDWIYAKGHVLPPANSFADLGFQFEKGLNVEFRESPITTVNGFVIFLHE